MYIREFEENRYAVQLEALKGEEQEKTKLEEMQKIYMELPRKLISNPLVLAFLVFLESSCSI